MMIKNQKTNVVTEPQYMKDEMYQSSRALDCPRSEIANFLNVLSMRADKTLTFEDIALAVAGA